MARETVMGATPASCATSLMVTCPVFRRRDRKEELDSSVTMAEF